MPVAGLTTFDETRDGHLQSPDFFDAERFPELRFASTSIASDGDDVVVDGDLTMKGVTKPVTLTGKLYGPDHRSVGQRADRPRPRRARSTATSSASAGTPRFRAGGSLLPDTVASAPASRRSRRPDDADPRRPRQPSRRIVQRRDRTRGVEPRAGRRRRRGVRRARAAPPVRRRRGRPRRASLGAGPARPIAAADALLFVTPEYNGSIPGVLKNAIDWASRPHRAWPLWGKTVAVAGATTGPVRGRLGARRSPPRARHRRRAGDRR